MNENWFNVILGVISILGTILTGILIPYFREKIGNEKIAKYEYWALTAVECAEMIFSNQGEGNAKKEYVVNFLNNIFNKKRTVLTSEQIEILVESAVKQMKINEHK